MALFGLIGQGIIPFDTTPQPDFYLLMETGDFLLLETSDKIILDD